MSSNDAPPKLDRQVLAASLALTSTWNFELAKQKLLETGYAGWSKERADKAEENYKRYLAIIAALGGYRPVPNADIDRFWHEHILDTERYATDCTSLFGHYLHHYPYFGMRGDADRSSWLNAAEFSAAIWKEAFGEELYRSILTSPDRPQPIHLEIPTNDVETNMSVTISITINVNGTPASETSGQLLQADIMKCPQKCPDRKSGMPTDGAPVEVVQPDNADIMKCPQKCPSPT